MEGNRLGNWPQTQAFHCSRHSFQRRQMRCHFDFGEVHDVLTRRNRLFTFPPTMLS